VSVPPRNNSVAKQKLRLPDSPQPDRRIEHEPLLSPATTDKYTPPLALYEALRGLIYRGHEFAED
jgi:hypothetical protein